MNTLRVALFSDRAKAEAIQRRLAQAGFTAETRDEGWLQALWFVTKRTAGTRIEVRADQFEKAEQFLLGLDAAVETALQGAIRCPECKSLRIEYPQGADHSLMTNLAMGLSAELGLVEKHYYCEDCHYTWPKETGQSRQDRPHMAPYYFIEGIDSTRHRPELSQGKDRMPT